MHISQIAVPIGRRTLPLAQISMDDDQETSQRQKSGLRKHNAPAVSKWQVLRILAELKKELGLSDRSLTLLAALVSFHPKTELMIADGSSESCAPLIVFPSNRQLALRAHGMAEKTLRRHLAALVEGGYIIRRDSPNGKRYARKALGGEGFSQAFGFDLTPLALRFAEFEHLYAQALLQRREWKVLKEEVSLLRRDVGAGLAMLEAEFPSAVTVEKFKTRFQSLLVPTRRIRTLDELRIVTQLLTTLKSELREILGPDVHMGELTVTDSQNDRHLSDSNTNDYFDSDSLAMACVEIPKLQPKANVEEAVSKKREIPLALVVQACPDVELFEPRGEKISNWPGFVRAAAAIRPMLGITAHAWEEAMRAMGSRDASIAIGFILQRGEFSSEAAIVPAGLAGATVLAVNGSPVIKSPGGYLRKLTEQSAQGKYSAASLLQSLVSQRHLQGRPTRNRTR